MAVTPDCQNAQPRGYWAELAVNQVRVSTLINPVTHWILTFPPGGHASNAPTRSATQTSSAHPGLAKAELRPRLKTALFELAESCCSLPA